MERVLSWETARDLLIGRVAPVEKEKVLLEQSAGRILGQDVTAVTDLPPFDRSPLDGYAFRAADAADASRDHPITLRVIEEIPAGGVPHLTVTEGCAAKILTGAPIPRGADVVTKYEITEFTDETVTVFEPARSGNNIVRAGEHVKAGEVLAECGIRIGPETMGTMASQNIAEPIVYRTPKIGIISTGNEILPVGSVPEAGKIFDSNQYMLSAVLRQVGCQPVFLGMANDCVETICGLIRNGLEECDGLILTGGVSVGDYDFTPAAMERAGVTVLFRGVDLKPGMACAYGIKDGKLLCGLSGNPTSAVTNFYAVALPAMKKLCGYQRVLPLEINARLLDGLKKESRVNRMLLGNLEFSDRKIGMRLRGKKEAGQSDSGGGCNVMALVPKGSGVLEEGRELRGFLIW